MLLIESILVLAAKFEALIFPSVGSRWFDTLGCRFSQFARQRALSAAAVGLRALALRTILLLVVSLVAGISQYDYLSAIPLLVLYVVPVSSAHEESKACQVSAY